MTLSGAIVSNDATATTTTDPADAKRVKEWGINPTELERLKELYRGSGIRGGRASPARKKMVKSAAAALTWKNDDDEKSVNDGRGKKKKRKGNFCCSFFFLFSIPLSVLS